MKIIEVKENDGLRYVLTQGRMGQVTNYGDFAAYYGDLQTPAINIAAHGEKLTASKAMAIFPAHLKDESVYRK